MIATSTLITLLSYKLPDELTTIIDRIVAVVALVVVVHMEVAEVVHIVVVALVAAARKTAQADHRQVVAVA